jgi:hypothetical protein
MRDQVLHPYKTTGRIIAVTATQELYLSRLLSFSGTHENPFEQKLI